MRRGIVICAGGKYIAPALRAVKRLRWLKCGLSIEVWRLSDNEMPEKSAQEFEGVGNLIVREPIVAPGGGWQLKPYALSHSAFDQALLLDADTWCERDPTFLFDAMLWAPGGTLFWPDAVAIKKSASMWKQAGIEPRRMGAIESGQVLLDKGKCETALEMCVQMNMASDHWYKHVYGDKDTFLLAWMKTATPYALVHTPMDLAPDGIWQHDLRGERLFRHDNEPDKDVCRLMPQTYEPLLVGERRKPRNETVHAVLGGHAK
jgi:Mannosyltransferase putative